jgi:hypothetical protein
MSKNSKHKNSQPDPMVQRLVELTFSDAATVAAWARSIGLEVVEGRGYVRLRNRSLDMVTGFAFDADPVNRAVCLGFATAGAYWPWAFPDLLKWVNREWDKQRVQDAAANGGDRNATTD